MVSASLSVESSRGQRVKSGEGRAAHPDHHFRPGDTAWLGDPPHEPQGWYGVFDSDASTQAVIREHAAAMAALPA